MHALITAGIIGVGGNPVCLRKYCRFFNALEKKLFFHSQAKSVFPSQNASNTYFYSSIQNISEQILQLCRSSGWSQPQGAVLGEGLRDHAGHPEYHPPEFSFTNNTWKEIMIKRWCLGVFGLKIGHRALSPALCSP